MYNNNVFLAIRLLSAFTFCKIEAIINYSL